MSASLSFCSSTSCAFVSSVEHVKSGGDDGVAVGDGSSVDCGCSGIICG